MPSLTENKGSLTLEHSLTIKTDRYAHPGRTIRKS